MKRKLMAMLLARDSHCKRTRPQHSIKYQGLPPEANRWRIFSSQVSHFSIQKSAALLGLALTRPSLRAYPGRIVWPLLARWQSWRPMLSVNRDIFIRSLALQGVFFLITVQGARMGEETVAANALLLNGLLLTAYALDGLAHAVEALCGHAIGAGDRPALRRSLVIAGGWSLIASVGFAVVFLLGGHLFIQMQTDIPGVRETAFEYLPYLALLPLIAVWSYLLDGLFIGATRAREMRDAMLLSVVIALPFAWLASGLGNHGLWLAFLLFMGLRGVTLGVMGWRLQRRGGWFVG
jgi:MATE family multidrug resistance protein